MPDGVEVQIRELILVRFTLRPVLYWSGSLCARSCRHFIPRNTVGSIFDGLRPDSEKTTSYKAADSVDKFKSAHESNADFGFSLSGEVRGGKRCLS